MKKHRHLMTFLYALILISMVRPVYSQTFQDDDGDGIPSAVDCAPFDSNISRYHTYYVDGDLDQQGDRFNLFPVCSLSPPPLLSPWGDDPDDSDDSIVSAMVDKGERLLSIDFGNGAENQPWQPELARELGADATVLNLYWSLLESSPSVYDGIQNALLSFAETAFGSEDLALSLTLSPLVGRYLSVPGDLYERLNSGQLAFNDPEVISRFNNLISHVHANLPNTRLISLQIGHEVDLYHPHAARAQFWTEYRDFLQAVSAHAKLLWGTSLKVGVTSSYQGLMDAPTRDAMQLLNSGTDQVNVTYHPRNPDLLAVDPFEIKTEIEALLAQHPGQPIAFQSVAFPSAVAAMSSETLQSQSLRALLEIWDQNANSIPFVNFGRLNDLGGNAVTRALEALDVSPGPTANAYVSTLGLRQYQGEGKAKAAYKTLRNFAFQRGWWRIPKPTERSFLMGFTSRSYDHSNDPIIRAEVDNWMNSHLDSHADIISIHMDSGIPWVEAYDDDFTNPTPPYSNDVLTTWNRLRNGVPAGKKLVVAINPTGVPRQVLAPYWGPGQSFTYDLDNDFKRLPTGDFQDAPNRMPPPPWDSYDFDSLEVKIAFLKYCLRAIDYFKPDYLVVAIESSVILTAAPERFPLWLELQSFVYQALKSNPFSKDIPIGVSVSATSLPADEYGLAIKSEQLEEGKMQLQREGFLQIAPFVDFMGLSFYPHDGKYYGHQLLASSFDDILDLVEQTGKPFAITESGYLAESVELAGFPIPLSPEKQDRYMKWLLYEVRKRGLEFEFLINFFIRDNDQAWAQTAAVAPWLFSEFYKFFRDIGIFDGNGNPRPSEATWKEMYDLPYVPND